MTDAASLKLLYHLIQVDSRSLLQYVHDSSPYATDAQSAARSQVLSVARTERDALARLTQLLQKKHLGLPKTGSYPSHFTTMNFVSIDYLLPKLIAEHEHEIVQIEALMRQASDPDALAVGQAHLDMKRKHLQTLRELAPRTTPAAAA